MITRIPCFVEVKNMSENAKDKDGFLVVRRDDDASLWYYGLYYTEEDARRAANEIGNGLVLEVSEREGAYRRTCRQVFKESCYLEQGITQC